jgi:hydroxymethylpyrimidine pyrophosphatase-like HAD family hydrolase
MRLQRVEGRDFAACGNGENDTAMLRNASHAFGPLNSVSSVKAVCSSVAPYPEGDSFVEWVRDQLIELLEK